MYCILTEHLAECERFKYFQSAKWSKVKIKSVPSSFFGLPFLYLPNVLIHEPNEFIHVRVVNKLSKVKFTVQRLSDLVLTYSVGKGDFWIVLPSSWNLLSVTLWCLHLEHCCSSTHVLYNFVHYIQFNQFFPLGEEHFFVRAKRALQGTDLAVPYRAPVIWVSLLTLNQRWHGLVSSGCTSMEHPYRVKLSLPNRPGSSCIEIAQLRQSLSHHSSTIVNSL